MHRNFGFGLDEPAAESASGPPARGDVSPGRMLQLMDELRDLYPEASDDQLEKAARTGDFDAACEVMAAGDGDSPMGEEVKLAAREDPKKELEKVKRLSKMLPKYNDEEVRGILLGFHGDCSKVEKMLLERPDLIDVMVEKCWMVDQVEQYDLEEKEKKRQEELSEIVRQNAEAKQIEAITYYEPPYKPSEAAWLEHKDILLRYASPADGAEGGHPRCWNGTHGVVTLDKGDEFYAVANYFSWTLTYRPRIMCIARVQNYETFDDFKGDEHNTPMFHGCRSDGNERSIALTGFQVNKCKSNWHGKGDGSWFAYKASYSDGSGFVFPDKNGLRHIFVCIVSKREVKLDNDTMRVVGQGCAIPLWIVTYKQSSGGYSS